MDGRSNKHESTQPLLEAKCQSWEEVREETVMPLRVLPMMPLAELNLKAADERAILWGQSPRARSRKHKDRE